MPGFGEYLRREREMRGVTLDEIAESTKISTRLLKALEQDRFSELPGGIFTRSFIRAYAQYLGLDDEHVLAEYRRAAQPGSDFDLARLSVTRPLPMPSGSRTKIVPWVVAAALLVGGYAVYRYAHRPAPIAASTALPGASAPAAPPSTAGPPSSVTQPAATNGLTGTPATTGVGGAPESAGGSGSASQAATPAATPPAAGQAKEPSAAPSAGSAANGAEGASPAALGDGGLLLKVSTTEESWVAVAADGKTLFQGLLPANSVRLFRANDAFDVTTGNAQGTVLALNGQTQKSLGRAGEFKKIHLDRSDFPSQTP